ncbi:MAG: hypothetical protein R3F11_01070 [Verrucomicrobiales bacterium]
MNEETLSKMGKLKEMLQTDPEFGNKFKEVFGEQGDDVFIHVKSKDAQLTAADGGGGCSCGMFGCGKGCFYGPNMPYPNKGHTVG